MTHDNLYIEANRRLNRYLTDKGKRRSMERNTILRLFCGEKKRWSANELVEVAAEQQISRATVYNALQTLVEAQVVRPIYGAYNTRQTIYELNHTQHNQLQIVCTKCHRITEVKDNVLAEMVSKKKYTNFRFSHFVMNIYGECKVCRKKR